MGEQLRPSVMTQSSLTDNVTSKLQRCAEANVILTQNEIPSPLVANYEFFLQNMNAFFSIIKHMTDIEAPRKRILQKLHDVEYRTFSFTQIKTQAKACLRVLQNLHLMAKDQSVLLSTKRFTRLVQNIVKSWDTFFYSIAVVDKGQGKTDLTSNIRLFYLLTKFDMAEFAKNLDKQKKRMELALSKSQINLNVGSSEGDSFKLKTLKFEELLFSSNSAYANEEEHLLTVEGLLDDSFEYVPKQTSDPKYYHPKKRSSYVTDKAILDKEQCDNDSFLKEQNEPRTVVQVDIGENTAALNGTDGATVEMPLQGNCTSSMSLDSSFKDIDVFSDSDKPLLTKNPFLSSATILEGDSNRFENPFKKSFTVNVTSKRGVKRKRDEPLCDVTNGLSSFPCHRSDLSFLKTASTLSPDDNVDCYNQNLKKVKLSRETENIIIDPNAVKNNSVEEIRFKGLKKLGRRLQTIKSRFVKGLRESKRRNTVFPIERQLRKDR
eukprot:gene12691-3404_t